VTQGGLATLADVEARHISRVLTHTAGQIGAAAEILGIHRNTLAKRVATYKKQDSPQKGTKGTNHKEALHYSKSA
jgi:DNA-binding NtrC family response regulator